MDSKEEVKWFRKGGAFYYIPERYRALIASIVAAFLFYNAFGILFQHNPSGDGDACGTLLRPVLSGVDSDGEASYPIGWIWNSGGNIFSLSDKIDCPRMMQGLWWEWFATIGGLIACGFVLRAAIKREEAAKTN